MAEKWNYEPRIEDQGGRLPPEAASDLLRLRPVEIPEIEKGERESAAIRDLNAAAGRVLADLGLPPLEVPDEAVHFVSPEDFRDKLKTKETSRSGWSSGHIYMKSGAPDEELISDLSHEMAHDVSYLSKRITTADKPGSEEAETSVKLKRLGFYFPIRAGREGFRGMNEATTEMFAMAMRDAYCDAKGLSEEQRRPYFEATAYSPQVLVMEKVCALLGGGDMQPGFEKLLRGFVTGDLSFLKELEGRHRGIVRQLCEMGTTQEDARRVAGELGFREEFDRTINALIEHKSKKDADSA